jgi:hypothetical protein
VGVIRIATVDGRVLRAWRRSRGWDAPEMASRLRKAAQTAHIPTLDRLVNMVYRWEREGLKTERYQLLYARALEIAPDDLPAGPEKASENESGTAHSMEEAANALSRVISNPEDARGTDSAGFRNALEEDQEEMERRRLLQGLAALGVQVSPFSQSLEKVRMALSETVGYDSGSNLEDWEAAVVEYGYSYIATPPVSLVPNLAADLVAVHSIIRRIPKDGSTYRSWCRVGGALSALMAKSLSNLGQPRDSSKWWSTAQNFTDASGDLDLGFWVRGERIIHGLYENRPIPVLSRQVETTAQFANDHPCAPCIGLAELSAGRAQVAVLSGDYPSAEAELRRMEGILGQLPSVVTRDTSTVMSWGEQRYRYTQAWVYSCMGDEARTDHAAERALSLYPASNSRTPAQVKLMQAFARVRRGDITEGIRQAQAVYEPLSSGQSIAMVDALADRVLTSVPVEAQKRSDVAAYRELVASSVPRDD